ncbi:MAG: hypothetical protein OHK0024_14490 [Thalassobaculales bacterium]
MQRILALVAALAVVAAGPARAAGGGAMPQLDVASFPGQVFWLIVSFVVLYLVMSRVALPRVEQVLEDRATRIGADLDRAQSLKAEAEGVMRSYEEALSAARAKAQAAVAEVAAAAQATAAKRDGEVTARLAEQARAAEQRIAAAKAAAMANVRDVAAEVAAAAVARLVGAGVSAEAAGAAVDRVMRGE